MTSRPGIRPSRFGLIARLAVTVVVAAGAMTGAVLVHSTPALAAGHATPAQPSAVTTAQAEAKTLIQDFVAPPGATRLVGAPSGLPASAVSDAATVPNVVSGEAWWRTTQDSAADLISWAAQHPEPGLTAFTPDLQISGASAPSISFSGSPTGSTIKTVSLTATAYAITGGVVLKLAVNVGYTPSRPTSEVLPPATQLIAVPTFAMGSKQSAPEVTVTDPAEIDQVEAVINGLSKASSTAYCPMDNGAGIALVFEGPQNSTLADVVVAVTGCGGGQVSIDGYTEPTLTGGRQAASLIQRILGVNWDLAQPAG